jgi:hypothetical protein
MVGVSGIGWKSTTGVGTGSTGKTPISSGTTAAEEAP